MNRRILVVDDEAIVAHDISECLSHLGCEIVGTALSGPDAIEKAGRFRPDLIMMDIVLQGPMDGVEAATHIREHYDIPCVFLSAYSDPAVLARAKIASPAGYLVKPFEEAGLRSAVEIALYKVDLERALRESKEWFMTMLLSIGDGVIATTAEGRVRFMNPLAEVLTGWHSSDASCRDIEDVFPIFSETSRLPMDNPVRPALLESRLVTCPQDTLLQRRDGTCLPIDSSATPIRSSRGETAGAVLIFRDITERRLVETEVQRYQNHLEELVTERTMEIQHTNRRLLAEVEERRRADEALARRLTMESLVARHSAAFLGHRPDEAATPLPEALKAIVDFLKLGRAYLLQFSADGSTVSCTDESCADGVAPAKSCFLQVPAAALPAAATHPGGRGLFIASSATEFPALAHSRGSYATLLLSLQDGHVCTGYLGIDATAGPREWTADDVTLLTMFGDLILTALGRWRAEQEKSTLQTQLQQSLKMEAVGKLSGGIAHDFNNMLLPIIGYSDMILARLDPADPSVVELTEIHRAANQAAALTRQLLAFSRKQVVKKTTFDLNNHLREMTRMLSRIIGEDIELRMSLCPGTLTLHADSGQVEQIIMNLCVNARDAMPQGGIIVVSTEARNAAESPLPLISSNATAGRYAAITVKDSGGGIPQAIQDQIFEPFFTTKGQEGTGLGLSVIYGIVQDHQGGIRLESTPEQGTTFRIFLPATAAEPTAPVPEATRPDKMQSLPRGTGQHVLLVEDEAAVNRLVRTALTQNGYTVTTAFCVKEALALFDEAEGNFDMIFSDAVLPDGNGVQLLDIFLSRNPTLRALLSSGYTDRDSLMQMARQRRISFLPKPYTLPTLFHTVADVMKDQNTHLLL
jgi:PAS domain S-box-containing protein